MDMRLLPIASVTIFALSCMDNTCIMGGGIRAAYRLVDAQANVGEYSSLALHPANKLPAITYYDGTNGDIKYAWLQENGSWQISVVDATGDVGGYTSLAFSSTGQPHVAYYDFGKRRPKYAYLDNSGWATATVPYDNDGGQNISLALDRQDNAHVSFNGDGSAGVEYLMFSPQAISIPITAATIDSAVMRDGIGGTKILLRTNEAGEQYPLICFNNARRGELDLATFSQPGRNSTNSNGWTINTLEAKGNNLSCLLTNNNIVHAVGYGRSTFTGNDGQYEAQALRYISHNIDTKVSQNEIIETVPYLATSTAIVMGLDEQPAIFYFDGETSDLKLAQKRDAGFWQTFIIDEKGVVGTWPSAILLGDGQFVVSYRDENNQALKFALFRSYDPESEGYASDCENNSR